MPNDILEDFRGNYEYDTNRWQDIRSEAKTDMQYVAGDPWTVNDKKQRKDRPTVAPEEMGQYFNQVINALRANPRGARFSPVGNGANDETAKFYQNKWREVEYRSHAALAYITAAENAIQRSYGFVEVTVKYANPRSANQDIWIEPFPNPDMVLPDTDSIRPDGSDMTRCLVQSWMPQKQFIKQYGRQAKQTNFARLQTEFQQFVKGDQVLLGKYWHIATKKRQLLLAQPPMPMQPPRQVAPSPTPAIAPIQVFADELAQYPGIQIIRPLRTVDYPTVKWMITNGIDVLDEGDWLGKYIPIVSCYGKVLYTEGAGGMEKTILSMTRFGRDPWKSYCYACSQQLEVLGMVPKSPLMMAKGQMDAIQMDQVVRSLHEPIATLTYNPTTDATGQQVLPPPMPVDYPVGQHLQALEIVKEGFRRAIQAAMGSNFLPTQAQHINDKSGKALDAIDQAATQGTYHFVNSYEDMIRQCGVIGEDLMDKIHDYRGTVDTIEADGKATQVEINDPSNKKAISTKGDHVVTISTAPSSDSEQEAAEKFTDTLVGNIEMVAGIAGQKAAAAVLASSIRMRNLGPKGDQLADLIEPPEYKTKDGQPPSAELLAAQGQIQQLQGELQKAAQVIQTKQIEGQSKLTVEKEKQQHEDYRAALDREVKLAVAEISAQSKQALQDMALFYEERSRLGAQMHERAMGNQEIAHNVHLADHAAANDAMEATKQRIHDRLMADQQHQHALEQGEQGVAGQLVVGQQAADNAPQPQAGA